MTKPYKGKILIVDDEEHQLLIYVRVLSSEGYEIFTATDGTGAIEMAKKHQPQLVLLDIVLPDISGIDVMKVLKKHPETQHCFVVLISSKLVSSEDQSEGLETGADAYLLKPIQNRELIARIDSFMRHKTAIDDLRKRDEHLRQIEWMLEDKQLMDEESYLPEYGDLSELNQNGLILNSVGREQLRNIASEYMDLLETSSAIYERNGDYALGLFSSGWCQMMDKASHALCNTTNNRKALDSEKWLCHESCWKDAALKAIETEKPADIECNGGIHLYAVPVKSGGNIVGVINFGYGDPPKDEKKLNELS